jgi:hypothetical protein
MYAGKSSNVVRRAAMNKIKRLSIIIIGLLLLSGCGIYPADLGRDEASAPEPVSGDSEEESPLGTIPQKDMTAYEHGEASPIFIGPNGGVEGLWQLHDGWIYYVDLNTMKELRKCKLDLSQDMQVATFDSPLEFYINPEGYYIMQNVEQYGTGRQTPRIVEWFVSSVLDDSREEIDLPTIGHKDNEILYQGNIFLNDHRETDTNSKFTLDWYDLDGNHVKTITEYFDSFGIVDDSIYFLPIESDDNEKPISIVDTVYNNAVMRYDIGNNVSEIVFEFELIEGEGSWKYYMPHAKFNGRNIIVQNDFTSYVYTSIDDIDPKSIVFDFPTDNSRSEDSNYIPSNDDNLYFNYRHYDESAADYDPIGSREYYMVMSGTTDLIKLKEFECRLPMFFADGYLYYLNDDYEICREKFLE